MSRDTQGSRAPAPTAAAPCARPHSRFARHLVPRAVVLPRSLQHLQLPGLSGTGTGNLGPRAVVLPRPLQHLQVPACTSTPKLCFPSRDYYQRNEETPINGVGSYGLSDPASYNFLHLCKALQLDLSRLTLKPLGLSHSHTSKVLKLSYKKCLGQALLPLRSAREQTRVSTSGHEYVFSEDGLGDLARRWRCWWRCGGTVPLAAAAGAEGGAGREERGVGEHHLISRAARRALAPSP